jgi:hypothetical protein
VSTRRSLGVFAAVAAGIIIAATLVLRMLFTTPAQRYAMLVSAGLAFAVQLGAYALVMPGRTGQGPAGELMIRWGMGAVIRLMALVLFALVARVMQLPLDAALVSLAVFFFLTMMAEPLLLDNVR